MAATYNVSYILVDTVSAMGLLYAAGTFLPVVGLWQSKVMFDARFVHEDDLYHSFYEILVLVILATAVLHIRSVEFLSHPSEHISMFIFSIALVLERVQMLLRRFTCLAWDRPRT